MAFIEAIEDLAQQERNKGDRALMPEERKLVTILFADVTGSTSLGEALDPEDVRVLMGCYYEHAREIVNTYGGTVEKFIGDAVMAVFGLPVAHDDDAERALDAALALRTATQEDALLGSSFQLRMGINTGEVMATSDPARGDFLVSGDPVNVAARLQQNANPDEIVASERTALAARRAFLFAQPREIVARGKQLLLRVFPLKEKRATPLVERPPFIGRTQDLLQLEILHERTREEERPQFVSIIAPAGTGKTRLLEEFLARLDPQENVRVATARCRPYGETMVYLPLQGLLRDLLGEEVNTERVIASFLSGGYRREDAQRLADHVMAISGYEGSVGIDRELIVSAWRVFIEALSRQAPSIIIFENLHWASESLLDLVEHICALHVRTSLLFLILSRPELLDRRPGWGGGRQNFTSLTLQPLSAKRCREFIARLAPDLPAAVSEQIAESAGGNPFFVQELVRGLAERGLAGQSATTDVLPDTIHAAVLARLDLLSKIEREVLQIASVANRTCTAELVQGIVPACTRGEIEAALGSLVARDMLARASGEAFTFHHGLLLDITYGTLARAERIRLHRAIAALLQQRAGDHLDDCVELLAYHYQKAVQLAKMSAVPQQMAVESERAITFQVRAGELACRAGAYSEALTYFQGAIELAGESERIALYEQLGDSLSRPWNVRIREAYQQALALWRTRPEGQALVGARLMRKLVVLNGRAYFAVKLTYEEGEALWREGVHLAEQAGDESELRRVQAAAIFLPGDLEELSTEQMRQSERVHALLHLAAEAASYFEAAGHWDALSEILDGYAGLQFRCGQSSQARATLQRRLQLAELSHSERMDAISSIANVSFLIGDYDAARQTLAEALDRLRPGEPFESLGNSIGTVLWGQYCTGRWSETERFCQALHEIRQRVQHIEGAGFPLVNGFSALLVLALSREDQQEADAILAHLRILAPWPQVSSLVQMYRDGDFSQFAMGKRGSDIAGLPIMLFCEHEHCPPAELFTLGDYYEDDLTLRASRVARALIADDNEALAQAIEDVEAHQLIVHAAHMRIVLARRSGDASHLARARPVLERLGDRLFLRTLQQVETMLQMSQH
jgi:class 3 adenylate cyclase/predicted ATPase